MTEKICPMTSLMECLKEKCAWWDDFNGRCAIAAIATYLRHGFKIKE